MNDAPERILAALLGVEEPFPWQLALLDRMRRGELPSALDIPTGLGKTSVMAIWLLAQAFPVGEKRLPKRLVYIVDRRAVVDQATEFAQRLEAEVAARPELGEQLGLDAHGLAVSTLRGQHADNRAWLARPHLPAIVVGTIDMVGSRLLFSGYGVSRKMRPYHAGLLGQDSLFVLDEAHLVPPFEHLLRAATEERLRRDLAGDGPDERLPPSRVLSLSATQRGALAADELFGLEPADFDNPVVAERLNASKRLRVLPAVVEKEHPQALAQAACELVEAHPNARVLVFSNSRDVAEKAKEHAEKLLKDKLGDKKWNRAELLVGARRVHERLDASARLEELGFIAGADDDGKGCALLFSTSAGEVGIDLDAHHMVSDLVHWERMIQRWGRVNRRGKLPADIVVVPQEVEEEGHFASAVRGLLAELPDEEDAVDVSPGSLMKLAHRRADEPRIESLWLASLSETPYYPALERPLLEAWSLTSLATHTGRPEVAPWLRGWLDTQPQTTVIWRGHLPRAQGKAMKTRLTRLFEAAAPHLEERLETETYRVKAWFLKVAARAAKAETKRRDAKDEDGLDLDDLVAVLLDGANEPTQFWTLAELEAMLGDDRQKKQLDRQLPNMTLVVHRSFGGLQGGLLDAKATEEVWTPEFDRSSSSPPSSGAVPWTTRLVKVDEEAPDLSAEGWRASLRLPTRLDDEGAPSVELEVLRKELDLSSEDEKGVSKTKQTLAEHQAWARARAEQIADGLRLSSELRTVLVEATALHDEGKAAKRWQHAFRAPTDAIYAKTKGPVDTKGLEGYRHELGSLTEVAASEALQGLGPDGLDLALHMVVAHHGYARPVISTSGFDALPPSAVEARAREVALRFLDLQTKWGPWGLAWLESLLRAADVWASRDLEEGKGG